MTYTVTFTVTLSDSDVSKKTIHAMAEQALQLMAQSYLDADRQIQVAASNDRWDYEAKWSEDERYTFDELAQYQPQQTTPPAVTLRMDDVVKAVRQLRSAEGVYAQYVQPTLYVNPKTADYLKSVDIDVEVQEQIGKNMAMNIDAMLRAQLMASNDVAKFAEGEK